MYMPYLMDGYAVALVLMVLGCRIAMRTVQGLRGMRFLVGALTGGLVGVILAATRPWAPAWIPVILANFIFFLSYLLYYGCIAEILAVPMGLMRPGIVLSVVAAVANAWFTWGYPSLTYRILVCSGCSGIIAGAASLLLIRYRDPAPDPVSLEPELAFGSVRRALAVLQASLFFLCAARCVLTVNFRPVDMIHLDLIQASFTYLNLLLYAVSGGALIWLALCVHRTELQSMAHTDGLTGLLNRRAFEQILGREIRRADRRGGSTAVLLLDIDRFKDVNDSMGHHAGDEVIRRVARTLRESVRPEDSLARYGGEEFVVMIREGTLEAAAEVAERLRLQIAGLAGLPGSLSITASLGVAASIPGDNPSELLLRCDEALYGSKRGGRNLVTSHRPFAVPVDVAPQLA